MSLIDLCHDIIGVIFGKLRFHDQQAFRGVCKAFRRCQIKRIPAELMDKFVETSDYTLYPWLEYVRLRENPQPAKTFGNLRMLVGVSITFCDISDGVLRMLPQLRRLQMASCNLGDNCLDGLVLHTLKLLQCTYYGVVPQIVGLKSLTVHGMAVRDSEIQRQIGLTSLSLYNTSATDGCTAGLTLAKLKLSEGMTVAAARSLHHLHKLSMYDQQSFPLDVARGLTNLTSLYAPFCPDITIEHFKLLPRLTYLNISGTSINTGFLQYTPMLTSLDICRNHYAIGVDLQYTPKLKYLNISMTSISTSFVRGLRSLETLIMYDCGELLQEADLIDIPLVRIDAVVSDEFKNIVMKRNELRKK
jgi:hypothetical protein